MEIQVSGEISGEYLAEVQHILADKEFLSLSQFVHHQWTNRLMHSINVSYLSWHIARKLGCDESAAARAGLLHDFCPYDFAKETPTGEHQAFFHPKAAASNSLQKFDLTQKETDAILTHMFPLGPVPQSREAWIITFADKLCAVMEGCHVAIALARRGRVVFVPASA
ncbi:MAG: HD domain-containing protein [Lachnospiraceae bacterium]|nr:HD domain-containing protein [Lachnospiraceae bacterium]